MAGVTSLPFKGVIGAIAKDLFDSDITMEVVNQQEEVERTGKKEHVVFMVAEQPKARARTETPRSPAGGQTPPSLHLQAAQPGRSPGRGHRVRPGKGRVLDAVG